MSKPAETRFPIHDLIRDRWSPLAFADTPVTDEQLGSLLEAARWAPSSYNEQPWAYVVGRNGDETFGKLFECLAEGNQPWAQNAPLLMLAVSKQAFDKNGKPNRHAEHDVGLANANLVLQATALGLHVHQMAGFNPSKARAAFSVPDGWEPLTMIAVGHIGDPSSLPEQYQQREASPRSRKDLSNFVFAGAWGETLGLAEGG